ncbi:MAG: trigger factor [Clostridiales bacterium]|jgi:trigger factor|nr:trigger factor [Clostridiales bacterium]
MSEISKSVLEKSSADENLVKITMEIEEGNFQAALQQAYLKNRARIALPGFRKGRVPRKMIEAQFGKNFFWEEALEDIFPDMYEAAIKEHTLDVVSRPKIVDFDEKEGGGMILSVETYVKPLFDVPDYAGLEHTKIDIEATEDEILEVLRDNVEKNARIISVTDRAAENGDIVNINFEGFVDGAPFEGGKSDNYELILGSATFIDSFEQQIEGRNIGENFDVNVTFPEEYNPPELANQPAVFKIKLLDIKQRELPELDDDFAQEISEHDTLDEFKAEIKEKLEERKKEMADREIENELAAALSKRVHGDFPESMLEGEINRLINEFADMIQGQGFHFERYMQMTGMTMQSMREMYKGDAEQNIRARLGLEAIARQEGFEASEEELNEEFERLAKFYRMEKDEFVENIGEIGRENLESDIKLKKAMDKVRSVAIAVEREIAEEEDA